jgi:hypothetical protein
MYLSTKMAELPQKVTTCWLQWMPAVHLFKGNIL